MAINILRAGNTNVGTVLACKKDYEPKNIITTALDGSVYIQSTGIATEKRNVSAYCPDAASRDRLDSAAKNGTLVTISAWNGSIIRGYIEKKVSWKEWKDEHGVGKFSLIVTEVV